MRVEVTTQQRIGQPIDIVSAYAADPSNAPDWYENIKSVEWVTPPPLKIGSRVAFVAKFLGRRLAYTYEITDHIPGEQLTMRTAQGPFPMETTYTWASLDDQTTTMTLRRVMRKRPSEPTTADLWRPRRSLVGVRSFTGREGDGRRSVTPRPSWSNREVE